MSSSVVKNGLEVLASGQNIEALRRLIVMAIIGRYLGTTSATEMSPSDSSLSAVLSRLPTKTLSEVSLISKGKTGIKDAQPGSFPLVVTAEDRSNTDHYDFQGPGVIIPLVSSTGHGDASLKRIHFQDGQYAVGSILAVVHPKDPSALSARYLYEYLSAFKDELLVSRMVGTANVSLTVAKIGEVPVPLIPIKGQHKIDELMSFCDRLESEQNDSAAAHTQLVETLLGILTQSADAADFEANWNRIAEHFDTLFTTEASIEALQKCVLQLAVMGKLVPQDRNDESAIELLKRISRDHSKLHSEEIYKKMERSSPIDDDDQPFELPIGWAWERIGSIADIRGGKRLPAGRNYSPEKTDHVYIQVTNMKNGTILLDNLKYIDDATRAEIARYTINAQDLYVTIAGTIGEVGCVPHQLDGMNLTENAAKLSFAEFNPVSLRMILSAPYVKRQFLDKANQQAQPKLALRSIAATVIAIPPLAEQCRIVAKVDELMAVCDQLKTAIQAAAAAQSTLSSALIQTALEAA